MADVAPSRNTVATGGHWKGRLLAVVAAVVATVVVYLIITLAFGQELSTPGMSGQAATELNVGAVVLVSAIASLAAWGLLALLEKFSAKARTIWTVVAVVALLLSLTGPMTGTGITTGNRLALALLHVVVGVVLIGFMRRTATNRSS